jgi:hypothetical protein
MNLLNWDAVVEGDSIVSLREVIENMRQVGALAEFVGVALKRGDDADVDQDLAQELTWETGALVQCLGKRALELLDAQAAPPAPTPIRQPRKRTARRRAA